MAMAAIAAEGCGGGASTPSQASAQSHSTQVGGAVVTYFGQPKPQLTATSGLVSVIGQAGATYSTVTLEPAPNLADTYLAYTRSSNGEPDLYVLPWTTQTEQVLYQTPFGVEYTTISAYGTVAFNTQINAPYTIRTDGTGLKALTFTGNPPFEYPSYAVDGTNRLAFKDSFGNLYVGPGTGGTATTIQTNATGANLCWNPAGTEIAYAVQNGGTATTDIYVTSPTGGVTTDVTPPALMGAGYLYPLSWSADAQTILAEYQPNGSSTSELIKFAYVSHNFFEIITPTGDSDANACYSPDGSKIILYRSSTGGATAGLYVADSTGGKQTLMLPDPSPNGSVGALAWSPFLPKETVVAASGSTFYRQSASGFLLSQNGNQFGSMVAFTANTPADAAIQAPASTSAYGAPLLFTLTADSITSIGYANSYFSPGTILTLSSTPSVVVTVDGQTGQVDLVAPAATPKTLPAKNADGTVTYKAAFKAIYDGKGKNLAPSGARQLVVSPKTGKLVSFQ